MHECSWLFDLGQRNRDSTNQWTTNMTSCQRQIEHKKCRMCMNNPYTAKCSFPFGLQHLFIHGILFFINSSSNQPFTCLTARSAPANHGTLWRRRSMASGPRGNGGERAKDAKDGKDDGENMWKISFGRSGGRSFLLVTRPR